MTGRKYAAPYNNYRYGFNGKEKDDDIHSLTAYDYGFRIYNPAIGRFLSVDPLFKGYPWYTPYQFAGNKPIISIDLDGLEEKITITKHGFKLKPQTQTTSAITLIDKARVQAAALAEIVNNLQLQEVQSPKEPIADREWGLNGQLTVDQQRAVIETTVAQFVVRTSERSSVVSSINPNMVTEVYAATFDFNYTLLGNKEKIDAVKAGVKTATTVIEYSAKAREITGKLPKVLDKVSTPASIISNSLEGNSLGVLQDIAGVIYKTSLTQLAKTVPSLASTANLLKSNPVTMTVTGVMTSIAPANNSEEIKQQNIQQLKIRTIAALLFLFENNNSSYRVTTNGNPTSNEYQRSGDNTKLNIVLPLKPPGQ